LVDSDAAKGEFVVFKRLVDEHKHDGAGRLRRPNQLFEALFSGINRGNRRVYKGMSTSSKYCFSIIFIVMLHDLASNQPK